MINTFAGKPPEPQESESPIAEKEVERIASQLHPNAILSPKRFDDADVARQRIVRAFANLTVQTKEYLTGLCDTLIIDQKSANLPGIFLKQLTADLYKTTGKRAPLTHDIVASLRLPDRINALEDYFRNAFRNGEIGDHILILTEHAISRNDESLVTCANLIKRIALEFQKEPEIRFAAVSIGKEFPTRVQARNQSLANDYTWYWGELGYSIGSIAFHREKLNELAYVEGSARPKMQSSADVDPSVEHAKADMIMLARELLPLVRNKKSE